MPTAATQKDEFYKSIIDNVSEGIYFVDRNRVITYWNAAAERITGYSAEEVVGHSCGENILNHVDKFGNHLCTTVCPLLDTMRTDNNNENTVWLHHKNGHRLPVFVRTSAIRDESGKIIGGVELFSENTYNEDLKQRVIDLEKMAMLDKLTQLPNRNYIDNELNLRYSEMRQLGWKLGVLFMDIDYFKKFNDEYGHQVGDLVLQFVAKIFSNNARGFDTYARWGGDEFIAVIPNIDKEVLHNIGERMRMLVENAFIIQEGQKISVTISVGGTIAHSDETQESTIKRADDLLYESKKNGRNRITVG